jgi:hypothetical protein
MSSLLQQDDESENTLEHNDPIEVIGVFWYKRLLKRHEVQFYHNVFFGQEDWSSLPSNTLSTKNAGIDYYNITKGRKQKLTIDRPMSKTAVKIRSGTLGEYGYEFILPNPMRASSQIISKVWTLFPDDSTIPIEYSIVQVIQHQYTSVQDLFRGQIDMHKGYSLYSFKVPPSFPSIHLPDKLSISHALGLIIGNDIIKLDINIS